VAVAAVDAQRAGAQRGGQFARLLERGELGRVAGGVEIAAAVEANAVVAGCVDLLQQVDAARHEAQHGVVGAGPPVAVGLGGFVAGERHGRTLVHQHDVAHALLHGQVIGCGDARNARAANDHFCHVTPLAFNQPNRSSHHTLPRVIACANLPAFRERARAIHVCVRSAWPIPGMSDACRAML
jgi:hypothetical protein